jgi:tetratricopeptide (TPR) repeat protein
MAVDLTEAREWHRRGELDRAARVYETALSENPDRAEALHLLGVVALQRGDPSRAEPLLVRAVALCPDDPEPLKALGEVYWTMGRREQAAECARAALRLRPDDVEALCNLGATLVDLKQPAAAIDCLRHALTLRPDLAAVHNNLGNALAAVGDSAGALSHFRQAAALAPAAAEPRNNLGKTLLELGAARAAIEPLREAVTLGPALVEARVNLGNALQGIGLLDAAAAVFRETASRHPNLAAAHAGLAGVLEQLGDTAGAVASLREALRRDPSHAGALARLATRLRADLPDAERSALEARLADPELDPRGRWTLEFGLAHVLDALGDFERAARLSLSANASQRADLQARGRGYDPDAHDAFVARLMAAFDTDAFARVHGWGSSSARPVFVVGLPRSGTTLVEQILGGLPGVFGAGELPLASETFAALPAAANRPGDPLDAWARLDRAGVERLATSHLDRLAAVNATADRVVDKMPENTHYLGLIAALFPRATVIHCRRDERDVALSCWMTHFDLIRWACDPKDIARRIATSRRLMAYWKGVLPVPLVEVDYEALVLDPEGQSRALAEGCGMTWDPACLAFHSAGRPVRTASTAQVRRPIYRSSIGRWRNYERALAPLFAGLSGGD